MDLSHCFTRLPAHLSGQSVRWEGAGEAAADPRTSEKAAVHSVTPGVEERGVPRQFAIQSLTVHTAPC